MRLILSEISFRLTILFFSSVIYILISFIQVALILLNNDLFGPHHMSNGVGN